MKKTITEAIKEVMLAAGKPLAVFEVYESIIAAGLYEFKADQPAQVVRAQIRRHCKDLNFPSASEKKYFQVFADGKYYVLPASIT